MVINQRLITHEYISSSENKKSLEDRLNNCRRVEHELKVQIEQTQLHLGQLKEKQLQNQQHLSELRSAIMSSTELPPEMWARIFEFAHGDDIYYIPHRPVLHDGEYDFHYKSCFPEHVCSTWRNIALHTPALWHRVTISVTNSDSSERLDKLTDFVKEFTRTRGTKDLRFDFPVCKNTVDEDEKFLALVKKLTLPLASQLERLTVSKWWCTTTIVIGLLELLPSLPSLREFTDLCYKNEKDGGPMTDLFREPVSNVTFSTLTGLHIGSSYGGMYLSPPMAYYLLTLSPQLKRCSLKIIPGEALLGFKFALAKGQLKLEHLESFDLIIHSDFDDEEIETIMKPFVFPSLKELIISTPESAPNDLLSRTLGELLQRSRCSLETHIIRDAVLSGEGLIKYLAMVPSLQKFSLLSIRPFQWGLLEKIGTAELLPKLKRLECYLESSVKSISLLKKLMRQRWGGRNGTDIIHLKVHYSKDEGKDLRWRMKALEEQFTVEGRTCSFEEVDWDPDSDSDSFIESDAFDDSDDA